MATRTSQNTSRPLVIVESPNKVKTISSILGSEYVVRASYGHIADITESREAVDIDAGFAVEYHLTDKGAEVVAGLRDDLSRASELILATDDDREGEMISHLLVQFLRPTVPVSRIVFHAITKDDVTRALEDRRSLNPELIEAARTRRVLDHLYGFHVSPVLWSKVRGGLGAGRVQSPALRLIVEREFARRAFVGTVYCGVEATLSMSPTVVGTLKSIAGVPVAASKDIDDAGVVAPSVELLAADTARALVDALTGVPLVVADTKSEKYTRRPRRPYVTSDLLSDIVNQLKVGAGRAQAIMNQLHEKGLITYPRTDSPSLSSSATQAAREMAVSMFGPGIVPDKPNHYFAKKKSSQEAHEAIRPANLEVRSPSGLQPQLRAVYDMVWRRTVASQMIDATGTTTTVTLRAEAHGHGECVFVASGTTITEPGHRRLFSSPDDDTPTPLATFTAGDTIEAASLDIKEHATRPPARYTEASLIKELEDLEIGRPSTYASAIESLRREYVWSKRGDRALIPTITGVAVHAFMSACFPALVDLQFTRQLEERLERVVDGDEQYEEVLSVFYSTGDEQWPSLASLIDETVTMYDPAEHPVLELGDHPVSGAPIVLKAGRQFQRRIAGAKRSTGSPYLKCGDRNVSVNDQTELATLTRERAVALIDVPKEGRVLGMSGKDEVLLRVGPYGPYVSCGDVRASVPDTVDLGNLDIDAARALVAARMAVVEGRKKKG